MKKKPSMDCKPDYITLGTKSKDNEFDMELPQFSPFELVLAESRYIILYDDICSESAKDVNTKLIAMAMKSPEPIILEINSRGGSVSDGIAIMNTIQTIPAPVITIINGEADSMAGFISVVGDRRFITPLSYWMGHPMKDGVEGNAQTIKDRGLYLESFETELQSIFKKKTKLNEEDFQKMMRGELWLNPQQCLEKGVVDEIIQINKEIILKPKTKKHKK